MIPLDAALPIGFNHTPLDRLSERRADTALIERLRARPTTRWYAFAADVPLLRVVGDAYDPLFSESELTVFGPPAQVLFLGVDAEDVAYFAQTFLPSSVDGILTNDAGMTARTDTLEKIDLRAVATRDLVDPGRLGAMGGAKALLNWHMRHGYCANCGHETRPVSFGWRRDCAHCSSQHFPRVDPVVIMLAVDRDRCLLGRQPRFAPGMYSALAGFMEPGETIEAAVRREIHEEAGIETAGVHFFASQPWPFPSSLMMGCFAVAHSTDIAIDTNELEDARWFTRTEVRQMLAGTHPDGLSAPKPFAIAHHLLTAFARSDRDGVPSFDGD